MKLKVLFASLIAGALLLSSCEQKFTPTYLDDIKVSQSYVAIDMTGGSVDITLTAEDAWNVSFIGTGYGTNKQATVDWVTVSPMSGSAAEDQVLTFEAAETLNGRNCVVLIECGSGDSKVTQYINVIQGLPVTEEVSCEEVIENGIDGKTYRVTGIRTTISNTDYGNWYLSDGTGELYIYGTKNANGQYPKDAEGGWEAFGIEVGDEVTVEGPKLTYGSTIELEDATLISVNKSLISVESVDPEDASFPLEGGNISVTLNCKGDGIGVEIPAEAQEWLSIASIGGTASAPVVTFQAAYNNLGDRNVTVTFTTKDDDGKEYTTEQSFFQKGSIVDATAAEINAAADGDTQYRLTGYIREVANDLYGNLYVTDFSGEVYVYGVLDENGESKQWANMGIDEGDIITVVGPKSSFKDDPQMVDVSVEDHKAVTDATLAEFMAAEPADDVWYRLTGTVEDLYNTEYGNFHLVDAAGNDVTVYGLVAGWGGPSGEFSTWADGIVKAGDVITIVGVRDEYNGTVQVGDAFFVSKAE